MPEYAFPISVNISKMLEIRYSPAKSALPAAVSMSRAILPVTDDKYSGPQKLDRELRRLRLNRPPVDYSTQSPI